MRAANDAQLAALEAAAGPLPRQTWERAELPSGTWIAAPSAAGERRWWWIASDAQLAGASALAGALTRTDADAWRAADRRRHPLDRRRHPGPVHSADRQPGTDPGRELHQGLLSRPEVVARSRYRGTVKRRMAYGRVEAGAQEGALANVDVYDAAQPDEPVGRVIDAARHAGSVSALFEIALAALPGDLRLGAADGRASRSRRCPIPFSPSKRAPDERLLSARLLSARMRPNPWKVISGRC